MPGLIAHYLFGQKVLEKYPENINQIILKNKYLFDIGLLGPDILFYYKPIKRNKVTKYARYLHHLKGKEVFEHALKSLENVENKEAYLSYILGFICHFTFDSNAHGYIQKKIKTDKINHHTIEWEFERYLMNNNNINAKKNERVKWININENDSKIISKFYEGTTKKEIYHSVNSIHFYDDFLLGSKIWKRLFVSFALHISGNYKSKNKLRMKQKPITKCFDSNLRLEKIMNKAINKDIKNTKSFIEKLNNNKPLLESFDKTFGPNENWQDILVLPLEEEKKYEI